MADLEDFFAKRDKKKKKTQTAKFDSDNVAKILEKKRIDSSKSSYQPSTIENNDHISEYKAQEDDDEWREAVEEKPDYSGLKIQELVLDDNEEEEKEGGVEEENQKEGPWRLPQSETTAAPVPVAPVETPKVEAPVPIVVEKPLVPEPKKEESVVENGGNTSEKTNIPPEVKEEPKPEAPAPKKYVPPAQRRALEEKEKALAAAAARAAAQPPAVKPSPAPVTPANPTPATTGGGGVGDTTKPATVAPVGKYVLPGRRGDSSSSSSGATGPHRPKKAVPSISDQEMFPSLGS